MSEHVVEFFEWLQLLTPLWAYVVLALIAYIENVVPPIPGDLAIVFGGYLAGVGHLSFAVVVLLSTAGGVLGFMTMFWIGHRFGDAALDPNRLRWLPKRKVYRARMWLLKWGYALVGANRFLSGLRSVISLTVGAAKMNGWKTALFATISAVAWTSIIAYLGSVIGANWEAVTNLFRLYGRLVGALMVVLIGARVAYVFWRRRGSGEDAGDSPGINSPAR